MVFLYDFFIFFYSLGIRIAALFGNQKAKKWIDGRENIFQIIESTISSDLKPQTSNLIWFHCSSLGEFEQGRPVIEKFRMQNSEFRIVLTFFSPSGYEIRKNYSGADYIFYLPIDTKRNAELFIELINPAAVYFVKYEYWHHYFHELKKKNIPLYIVSAIFRDDQIFFMWYGKFFRNILKCVRHFFVQDESSLKKINSLRITNVTVTGDTRFDRVAQIAASRKEIPLVEKFCEGSKVIVAGSTWLKDEEILINFNLQSSNFKLIVAPHEISENRISEVEKIFSEKKVLRFSKASEQNISGADVLIIDSIGMLSSLYHYGWITYVGGGFSKGIHNILEAAVYGKPVFFGSNYQKANEAKALIEKGGAFSIRNSIELQNQLEMFLKNDSVYSASSEASRKFVASNLGATEKIIQITT
jgi:3-deoxy-D-manno-octulosonic-acid transferase